MASEEETIIAFVFHRSGKSEMEFSEFYLTLSVDLNWFTPDDAKAFASGLVKNKFLLKSKELVKPGFDTSKIKVPLGFYPSKQVLSEKKPEMKKDSSLEGNVLELIIKKIAEKSKLDEKTITKKIKEIEKEKNIAPEIAALLVGKECNVEVEEFYKKIEDKIVA